MEEIGTFVGKASIHVILEIVEMQNCPLNILYFQLFRFTFTFLFFIRKSIFTDLHSSITTMVSRSIIIKSEIRLGLVIIILILLFLTIVGKNQDAVFILTYTLS